MSENKCSVILMNNNSFPSNKDKPNSVQSFFASVKMYFSVPLKELHHRILVSMVPPIMGATYQRVYVDMLGPCIALLIIAALLHYGHASKLPSATANTSPTEALLLYVTIMPVLAYGLGRLGRANVTFLEMTALLGYALYGHVFTFVVSLLFYQEKSNTFFFCCLILFGGLSALRVVLILLASIPVPAARLFICSSIATLQLLSLILLHFAYMHRTFVYRATGSSRSKHN